MDEPAAPTDKHFALGRFVQNPRDDIKPRRLGNFLIAREHDAKRAAQRDIVPSKNLTACGQPTFDSKMH